VSAPTATVTMTTDDARVLLPEVVALAGDPSRGTAEQATWLVVACQLAYQLRGHK